MIYQYTISAPVTYISLYKKVQLVKGLRVPMQCPTQCAIHSKPYTKLTATHTQQHANRRETATYKHHIKINRQHTNNTPSIHFNEKPHSCNSDNSLKKQWGWLNRRWQPLSTTVGQNTWTNRTKSWEKSRTSCDNYFSLQALHNQGTSNYV